MAHHRISAGNGDHDSLYRLSHGTLFFQKIISDLCFPVFYRLRGRRIFSQHLSSSFGPCGAGAGGRNPSAASPGCGIPALPARRARHHYGHCRAHHRICAGFWPYFCRMDCGFIWLAEHFLYYVRPCCPEHCIGHSKTSGRRKAFGRKAGYPLRNTVNHRLLRSFDWRLQPGNLRLFLTCSLRSSGGGDSVHRAFLPAAAEASLPSS